MIRYFPWLHEWQHSSAGKAYWVKLSALQVSFLLRLHPHQLVPLGLELGGQGLPVPGVLHDALHCDPLLHICLENGI